MPGLLAHGRHDSSNVAAGAVVALCYVGNGEPAQEELENVNFEKFEFTGNKLVEGEFVEDGVFVWVELEH